MSKLENEHKELTDILQREKGTFFTILENYPIGVVLIKPYATFQYVNPEFTRITGYTLQDVASGRDWFNKAYPDQLYRAKVIDTWKLDRKSKAGRSIDR